MKENLNILFNDDEEKTFLFSVMHRKNRNNLEPSRRRGGTGRSMSTSGFRGRNLWFFGQEVFSKSSLSGISQIAESRTWARRILWIILFVSCILGFFYHATTYFSLYAAYPTTVDVRVENKGHLEFPELISICFIEYTFNTRSVARCAESSDVHEIVNSGKTVYLLPMILTEYPPIRQSQWELK
ncbi:uncharacterized protein TNCV_1311361 [Trichonephila clavipes]|nr:uncharacterized protein TNCV_1311361 [Trichonephila clavipes]